jgi:polyhydroxybutyrate depolymerase
VKLRRALTPRAAFVSAASVAFAALCALSLLHCTRNTINAGPEGATTRYTMRVAGVTRTYLVHIPAHYDTIRRAPLVIVLHGHGESAENFEKYTGMRDKADAEGFIAVYPQALGDPSDWHTAIDGPSKRDDIRFVRNIIDLLERRFRIDKRRIFAAGHSNGGIMTYRLASALSDRIAAIGVTAGSIGMIEDNGDTVRIAPPSHPVSVIHFHGLADPSVPYLGGAESDGPDNIISVSNTIAFWLNADHCAHAPTSRSVSSDRNVIIDSYSGCAKGTAVTLYTIIDGTHRWPGDDVPWYTFPGRDDSDVVATDVMWSFFAAHPRVN